MKYLKIDDFIEKLNLNGIYHKHIIIQHKKYLCVLTYCYVELYSMLKGNYHYIRSYNFYSNSKGLYFNFKGKRYYL